MFSDNAQPHWSSFETPESNPRVGMMLAELWHDWFEILSQVAYQTHRACEFLAESGGLSNAHLMFGTRWLATLAGLAFFSHQVGGFLGVWLGGVVFVRTGSYDAVWWLSVLFGVLSAVINLPIVEKPVQRLAAASA